jgi:hypothetical protein
MKSKIETLNLIIGKVYSPERIIKEIEKFGDNSRIEIGHAFIADNKKLITPYHDYHLNTLKLKNLIELGIQKDKEALEKLTEELIAKGTKPKEVKQIISNLGKLEIHVQVLSIVNPCQQNFAYKLIMSDDVQESLMDTSADTLIDMNDLKKHEYTNRGVGAAVKCINCVLGKNGFADYKARFHSEDKKHFVLIQHIGEVRENEECNCEE